MDVVIQSFWTKPISDDAKLKSTLYIAALSLAYAHRSGYEVHMHTDRKGIELLRNFGYDELHTTLDDIPESVSPVLFAAGKYYAMKAEGVLGKCHIDLDVFLKKRGILDVFYRNKGVDAICQQEEDVSWGTHDDISYNMHVLGYPPTTRPDWPYSMNVGLLGFHNKELADKYFDNYFAATELYTNEKIDAYGVKNSSMAFDFILEQHALHYMSIGYNIYTLLPKKNSGAAADILGYQHLMGGTKYQNNIQEKIKRQLMVIDPKLFNRI